MPLALWLGVVAVVLLGPTCGAGLGAPQQCTCAEQTSCAGGTVTVKSARTGDCDAGACVSADTACTSGCAVEGCRLNGALLDPARLCAETPPRQEGDPCAADSDCFAPAVEVAVDGGSVTTYLVCDRDTLRCAVYVPPAVDWRVPAYRISCP